MFGLKVTRKVHISFDHPSYVHLVMENNLGGPLIRLIGTVSVA